MKEFVPTFTSQGSQPALTTNTSVSKLAPKLLIQTKSSKATDNSGHSLMPIASLQSLGGTSLSSIPVQSPRPTVDVEPTVEIQEPPQLQL